MGSFSILNNLASVNGQQQLNIINVHLNRTLNRLSSGKRINSGMDDAAGLQIADSLRGNVMALNQAVRNAGDGIAFLQIVDGALNEMTNILTRAVTLASEAASEPISDSGRRSLDQEFQQIQAEIARIALDTNYNGMNLFIYDAVSSEYANLEKQINSLDSADPLIAGLKAKQQEILDALNSNSSGSNVLNPADILERAAKNRDFGETLDVFIGDLSAVSYINVNFGSIVVGTPIYEPKLEDKPETVPMSQVVINKVVPDNAVDALGRPVFKAFNNNGEEIDLLFQAPGNPLTSNPVIKVGTTTYYLWPPYSGETPNAALSITSQTADGMVTTYKLPAASGVDLTIIQTVSVVNTPGGQSYEMKYEVINPDDAEFKFMFHADTQLGADAPFVVGGTQVTGDTPYVGATVPGSVEIVGEAPIVVNGSPSNLVVNGIITFGSGNKPNELQLGQQSRVGNSLFNPGQSADNYGFAAIWDYTGVNTTTNAVMTISYGVKTPSVYSSGGQYLTGGIVQVWEDVLVGYDTSQGGDKIITLGGNGATGLHTTNLLTAGSAAAALSDIEAALSEIAIMRGSVGAGMNRLQAAISVLQTQARNTLAAESQIRDASIAEEISNLTKYQILAQSGIAALAQANSNGQLVLRLLQ